MSRRGVQRAVFEVKVADLASDFGLGLLKRKFGADGAAIITETFGQISRGPRKGQARGYIHWVKCSVGGWTWAFDIHGSVLVPGSSRYRVTLNGNLDDKTCIKVRDWCLPESASAEEWHTLLRKMAVSLVPAKRR